MTARPAKTCIEVHNDKTRKTKNKTLVNNFSLFTENLIFNLPTRSEREWDGR